MLSSRPNNITIPNDSTKDGAKLNKLKMSNKLRNTTNTKKGGLKVSTNIRLAESKSNKPKPLQASTNTIHSQPLRVPTGIKTDKKAADEDDLLKKKAQPTKIQPHDGKKSATTPKIDENTVNPFIKDPYNPLLDVHQFDEELYQKVLKLELADDGLPIFDHDEPFDF